MNEEFRHSKQGVKWSVGGGLDVVQVLRLAPIRHLIMSNNGELQSEASTKFQSIKNAFFL